jgi:hypothetical protein
VTVFGRWLHLATFLRGETQPLSVALTVGGFSADDIKEIIIQQATYCGVAASNHAFREAEAVLKEIGKAP